MKGMVDLTYFLTFCVSSYLGICKILSISDAVVVILDNANLIS